MPVAFNLPENFQCFVRMNFEEGLDFCGNFLGSTRQFFGKKHWTVNEDL
jgi:hypothetical protein